MDYIVELPPSLQWGQGIKYDAILVVVDHLTKMAHFIPTLTKVTSPELANLFVQHIFSRHGVPSDIISD